MPIARFYIAAASNGTLARYPSTSSALTILQNTATTSYVYIDNGSSTDPAYGSLAVSFGRSQVEAKLGKTAKINGCVFGMTCATMDSSTFYYNLGKLTLNNKTLLLAANPGAMGVFVNESAAKAINPVTNTSWQLKDFDDDIILTLQVEGQYGYRVACIYVDISYIIHEVFRTQKGKIKVKISSGIIEIPYFNIFDIEYPALRVSTSKGIYTFCLVDTTDSYASPIRISTPKGIKAIAYIK